MPRRRFLAGAVAGSAVLALRPVLPAGAGRSSIDLGDGFVIEPRAAWAGSLVPTGPLSPEPDVQVLLVHHSVDANDYAQDAVPTLLQGIYGLHTGPEKGWPDVAYNFFVDRYGGVWEGREGSATAAVAGDATGGNQGSTQLCCFIGDHSVEPPTAEAVDAMTHLLAWLGEREGVDTSPGATASFTSRGSNLWPAGATVTATTIAGHREMSATACPGDGAFRLVKEEFPERVTTIRLGRALQAQTTTTTAPTTTTSNPTSSTTTAAAGSTEQASAARGSGDDALLGKALVGGGLAGLVVAGVAALRFRRSRHAAGP